MKEQYISPEAKLTCFAPVESLATGNSVTMDDLFLAAGGNSGGGQLSTTESIPGFDLEFDA